MTTETRLRAALCAMLGAYWSGEDECQCAAVAEALAALGSPHPTPDDCEDGCCDCPCSRCCDIDDLTDRDAGADPERDED